ncbi:hypothetical protein [Longivirga aurantiaca]|uniref:Uncharacterized protein n=1 Tax=Longivirga aurantiaca TaxID=1837743 RepID=A0ABW1T5S1_9ACTN
MPHRTVLVEPATPRSLALVSDALRAEGLEVSGSGYSEERRDLTTAVELVGAYRMAKATDKVVDRGLDEAIDRVAAAVKAAWSITVRRRD